MLIFRQLDDCLLYPAHDYRGITVTSVREEKRFNPRLGGEVDEADFVGYMNHLGLPHPKQMAVAVPANLRSGEPEGGRLPPEEPRWAPLTYRFSGIWEGPGRGAQSAGLRVNTRLHFAECAARPTSGPRFFA